MSAARTRGDLLGALATLSAYALLYLAWVSSREFAHTYEHWVEGVDPSLLPTLTSWALPFIGLAGRASASEFLAIIIWFAATIWPSASFVIFLRSVGSSRLSFLALGLFTWLTLFLAATTLVVIGLWVPFGLL